MSLAAFLKFVEIKTKLASLFPFLVGTFFVYFRYGTFKPMNTFISLMAMIIFDLTTTAINNYMDYKRQRVKHTGKLKILSARRIFRRKQRS